MFTCIRTKILQLEQRQLYGSSRLGLITQEVRIAENASLPDILPAYNTVNAPLVYRNALPVSGPIYCLYTCKTDFGNKLFGIPEF